MNFKNIVVACVCACLVLLLLVFFPSDNKTSEFISSTETALKQILQSDSLVVGVDIPYGVMEFYDSNGSEAGIDIDIVRELSGRLGVKVRFEVMPFDELFAAVRGRRIHIAVSAITITPERQKTLLFSDPYLDAGMSLAVKADNSNINSQIDLVGQKIAVLKGTVGEELARSSDLFKQSEIVTYQKNDERMADLDNAVVDAAIVHFLTTDNDKIKLVGDPLSQSFYGIVTHLENSELIAQLNEYLRDMKRNGTIRQIKQKYASG